MKQTRQDVARKSRVVLVRIKYVSGRYVHTNRGVFHYTELESPEKPVGFSPEPFKPEFPPR